MQQANSSNRQSCNILGSTKLEMAHLYDPYADIDFEEINEDTGLATDEIKCLKVSIQM